MIIRTIHARVVDEFSQVHIATFALDEFGASPEILPISLPYAVERLTRQVTISSGCLASELSWEVHEFELKSEP